MIRWMIALLALTGVTSALPAAKPRDWTTVATRTADGGYVIGNPAARVKLVEYLSYTCPHCADFAKESQVVLRGQVVRSGSTSIEVRPAVREALDMAAAMLARCAGPGRFARVNDAIFAGQSIWYQRGSDFSDANAGRLNMYPVLGRLKAMAQGAGLDAIAQAQGMPAASIDACFTTDTDLKRLTASAATIWGKIDGTPAFAVNGKLVQDTDWAKLEPMLRAAGAR